MSLTRHGDLVAVACWYRATDTERERLSMNTKFMERVNRGSADLPSIDAVMRHWGHAK